MWITCVFRSMAAVYHASRRLPPIGVALPAPPTISASMGSVLPSDLRRNAPRPALEDLCVWLVAVSRSSHQLTAASWAGIAPWIQTVWQGTAFPSRIRMPVAKTAQHVAPIAAVWPGNAFPRVWLAAIRPATLDQAASVWTARARRSRTPRHAASPVKLEAAASAPRAISVPDLNVSPSPARPAALLAAKIAPQTTCARHGTVSRLQIL